MSAIYCHFLRIFFVAAAAILLNIALAPSSVAHVISHSGNDVAGDDCGPGSGGSGNINCFDFSIEPTGFSVTKITDMRSDFFVTNAHIFQITGYENCFVGFSPPCRVAQGSPVTHRLIADMRNNSGDDWTDFSFQFEAVAAITLIDLAFSDNGADTASLFSSQISSGPALIELFFQDPVLSGSDFQITLDLFYPLSGNACLNCQVTASPGLEFEAPPQTPSRGVPEPGVLPLFALGIAGIALLRVRSRPKPSARP